MKRFVALVLSIMVLTTSVLAAPATALESMRASKFFDGYVINLSARGDTEMIVDFCVLGTGTMDKIGVYSLRIEEQVDIDIWNEVFTVYGSDDPSNFYSYDIIDHAGSFSFNGYSGVKYRAVIVGYAENSSGHEYSREIASAGRVCK